MKKCMAGLLAFGILLGTISSIQLQPSTLAYNPPLPPSAPLLAYDPPLPPAPYFEMKG